MPLSPSLTLSNGVRIPQLGLGTWRMDDDEAERAVSEALALGYRHIDTASMYRNEAGVGRALRASGIPRNEIFLTTKVWPTEFFDVEGAMQKSLERLGLAAVDLYLIHWSIPAMPQSIWKHMENIYKDELARAIGVSNYDISELHHLATYAKIQPMINQVKCNPFDWNPKLLAYCKAHDIVFEAYTPLTRGDKLGDPRIIAIAQKYGRTAAQVLLRWNIEHGMVTIPKSSNPERMRENHAIFDFALAPEDIAALDALVH